MPYIICWKCRRSVEPLDRRETDKRSHKTWVITYCPFERCNANLDICIAPKIKLWDGKYFIDETDDNET